jgi:hypothetical protein
VSSLLSERGRTGLHGIRHLAIEVSHNLQLSSGPIRFVAPESRREYWIHVRPFRAAACNLLADNVTAEAEPSKLWIRAFRVDPNSINTLSYPAHKIQERMQIENKTAKEPRPPCYGVLVTSSLGP